MNRILFAAVLVTAVVPAYGQSLLNLPTPLVTLPGAPVLDLADPATSVQRLLTETSIPALDGGAPMLGSSLPALDLPTSTLAPLPGLGPILQP